MSRSVRNIMVVGGVVGLAILAGACTQSCQPNPVSGTNPSGPGQGPGPGNDNDRPPIIVSDGSVTMRVVAKDRGNGTNQQRGYWRPDSATATWVHEHGGPPVKNLAVNVMNGAGPAGSNCDNPEFDFVVRELTITYGSQTQDKTFRIFVKSKNLMNPNGPGFLVTDAAGSEDSNAKMNFWFSVGDATDHLKSVKFGTAGPTCTVETGKTFQLHIYQSTKH